MSAELEPLIAAYLDGTLDAAGAQILAETIRGGGTSARLIREHLALAGELAQACDSSDGATVERAVAERMRADGSATAFVAAVGRGLGRRSPRRRARRTWPVALAAAAVIAVALTAWWQLAASPDPVGACRIVAMAGGGAVDRNGLAIPAHDGQVLVVGDHITATASLTVSFPDGSRIALADGGVARVVGPQALRLERGRLDAEIAPQQAEMPFAITTPEAAVTVLGTAFTVVADASGTRVDLYRGVVQLAGVASRAGITLHAGDSARVTADGTLATIPAWRPLFPAQLAGWQQQHGHWELIGGSVRGSDPAGGKARLLGEQDLLDLELVCRLRIAGVESAELQVGDYNWFFTIPTTPGRWVEVRLQQHGETLSCTADGLVLPREAGDGAAMRPGPLGFYVAPHGSLEITDAQIATPAGTTP